MSELSRNNKYLIVQAKVVLTPIIDAQIVHMDKEFEKADKKGVVTSGYRDPESQLDVIRQYLVQKGLSGRYDMAMNCKAHDRTGDQYVWQMAWSNLLNIGVIINPPFAAKCLMDYVNKVGQNRRGAIINQTPHASGLAYNIGGAGNGVSDEAAIVANAHTNQIPGLLSYLIERENNAIHCNCYKIK